MGTTPSLVVAPNTPQTPLFDPQTGQMSYIWIKWFQNMTQAVNAGLNIIGQFIGQFSSSATIAGRGGTIGSITENLDDSGVVLGPGVDFARPYANKTTDHIADGAGSPLAGGRTAFTALVASGPVSGRSLVFNGSTWQPAQVQYSNVSGTPTVPNTQAAGLHKWFNSYNDTTGNFTGLQPAFSDISGAATAGQVPALSALTGAITAGQLPANVPVVNFGTGAPVGSSTEGYIYFDTTGTPYHGYVFHSGAWVQFS